MFLIVRKNGLALVLPLLMRSLFALFLCQASFSLAQTLPIPRVQVMPLPHGISTFQLDGQELTSAHYNADDRRPFWHPILTSKGINLVRMGHPHDPVTHSHHNGVWISHSNVNGIDFWGDHAKVQGRIVTKSTDFYADTDTSAVMQMTNLWIKAEDKALQLTETRRAEVVPLEGRKSWLMIIDLEFAAPKDHPATLAPSFFGLVGVRMAKSIGVHDGGGRILNSAGQLNEKEVFRQPAKWCDYSGRITNEADGFGGITLMDHPGNPQHGKAVHVRDDGWMCACTSPEAPIEITDTQKLRLRYALWVHDGVTTQAQSEAQWVEFAKRPLADLVVKKK